ncbi:MAG: anaerobic ribonucleoside-triphosphate reductase activating protein [Oscillospiraceae bacterium]|jgi:anaerobic ribonucleoside-triphosphate reductase activating protein|nr:anaerobic ribonucleoside-triphosphate reductase activating protein [Oscillospiraceae bacterium]
MRVAGIVQDSIVDGPGLRFTVFAQGCPHRCEGCHNPQTHDPGGGEERDTRDMIAEMLRNPLTDGLTLSGGEPFAQAGECAEIAQAAKNAGLDVWTYTGYAFEELRVLAERDTGAAELLRLTDVLVDGRFILARRSLELRWRGSGNQRLIDVPKTLERKEVYELVCDGEPCHARQGAGV